MIKDTEDMYANVHHSLKRQTKIANMLGVVSVFVIVISVAVIVFVCTSATKTDADDNNIHKTAIETIINEEEADSTTTSTISEAVQEDIPIVENPPLHN